MLPNQISLPAVPNENELALISVAIERLEEDWNLGEAHKDLGRYLPEAPENLRRQILIELIKVDQEFRLRGGEMRKVEEYLHARPALANDVHALRELLEAECLTRAAFADMPSREELAGRFPSIAESVDLDSIKRKAEREEFALFLPEVASENSARVATISPGHAFGKYRIDSVLGRGGMGMVYSGHDTMLDRPVAIKVPHQEWMAHPEMAGRFLREARLAAAVEHENLLHIHEVGSVDGIHYVAMALVQGQTLHEWQKDRRLDCEDIARLMLQITSAVEAIHAAGIIHRDVTSRNVMVDKHGKPKLMDFGLAWFPSGEQNRTDRSFFSGTPAAMAPEQVNGHTDQIDERTDIYGLGVILYELLTGSLPFTGPPRKILPEILKRTPTPPNRSSACVDERLSAICMKALAKGPAERYPSAKELTTALNECLESRSAHKLWRGMVVLICAVLFIGIAGALLIANDGDKELSANTTKNAVPLSLDKQEIRGLVGKAQYGRYFENAQQLHWDDSGKLQQLGHITTKNQRDFYKVQSDADGWMRVIVDGLAGGLDPMVTAYDTNGRMIKLLDMNHNRFGRHAGLSFVKEPHAFYYIEVSGEGGSKGPYVLSLHQQGERPVWDQHDEEWSAPQPRNDSPRTQAEPQELFFDERGEAVANGSIEVPGASEWFEFVATRDGLLIVEIDKLISSLDANVILHGPHGTKEDDSLLNEDVRRSDTLLLQVKSIDPPRRRQDAVGRYILRIRQMEMRNAVDADDIE